MATLTKEEIEHAVVANLDAELAKAKAAAFCLRSQTRMA